MPPGTVLAPGEWSLSLNLVFLFRPPPQPAAPGMIAPSCFAVEGNDEVAVLQVHGRGKEMFKIFHSTFFCEIIINSPRIVLFPCQKIYSLIIRCLCRIQKGELPGNPKKFRVAPKKKRMSFGQG